jgi:hypothetical protein
MFSDHDPSASAPAGPGGARCVVPSHRGRQGGGGRGRRSRHRRFDRGRSLRRRHHQGGGFSLRHSSTLGQRRQGPAAGIPQGTQRGLQHDEQDVKPLSGLALVHPEQPSLHHLEGIGFQGGPDTQQPLFGRRQRTARVGSLPAGRARLPIEAPLGHLGVKGGLNRRDQASKLIQGQTGQIRHLKRASLEVGESSLPHRCGLLSLEAQEIINRNKLYCSHIGLDYFAIDGSFPYGVAVFWPASGAYSISPITFFPDIRRSPTSIDFVSSLFSIHNLWAVSVEVLFLFPLVLLILFGLAGGEGCRRASGLPQRF